MPAASDSRSARRTISSLALTAALATVVVGCASDVESTPAPVDTTPGIGHIHGLGVDSLTGAIYLAAHGGVYEVPASDSDEAIGWRQLEGPIAGRALDAMGFTMLDGQMFASGHPDPRDLDLDTSPANLGLITSTDTAQTWQNVSLSGEVDFHDVAVAPAPDGELNVYGYRAADGVVMASGDSGATWSLGATLIARDLTVDADSADTVYATTEDGLMVSDDRGATFAFLEGAPPVYLIQSVHGADAGLVGIDLTGNVWVQEAGTWRQSGSTSGEVEAMTFAASPTPVLVVADDRGLSVSSDFGATWRILVDK
ncbi:WD40/YVTN/BNR-like repeat-containing protein [Marisediminicola antarctica]|uniref:Exo-alpha-sialidase n=1 Tax=Marisediminicola antarctica TaxID=674079 RepID=A0A7L5AEP0_9MICO|nr:hypothetical protein [Marisediminicola antarctica]QHO68547.1 hypothetical protein BHD05_01780 [Marisediminicola antarctica]